MWKSLLLSVACLSSISPALAVECPVEKFTISDLERLKFSESLALSVIDTMESSSKTQTDKGFNIGVIIKGAPVNVSGKDMKAVSDYVKKNSDVSFSRDQQLDFLRTNVSLVSASMYSECLKRRSQNFSVDVPTTAYTEDDFIIKVRWTPTYSISDRKSASADAKVQVLNGTVDGKESSTKSVEDKKSTTFVVHRKEHGKSVQIIPTVDGYDNGEDVGIIIPPILALNYVTRLRVWPGPGDVPFAPMCSDDGGGNCGSGPKTVVKCIHASDTGLILPSSLSVESTSSSAPAPEPLSDNDATKVCLRFGTYGVDHFGKKGYSALTSMKFFVREIVPGK